MVADLFRLVSSFMCLIFYKEKVKITEICEKISHFYAAEICFFFFFLILLIIPHIFFFRPFVGPWTTGWAPASYND